ncbi:hypothetical protein FUA23_19575 [Neolewinella aurantiaca]|uniref:Uncharacterized protein n=1 Tax=Neolewinella aurantiaca TaxID=2602767 RepID=A0A5C7F6H2_9BACT|nr:hypothetical protein [Neolewinella aurantiaca]TXF86321.1 hypothetical protein FUA23_19575 [Neolewinella aurantiaca]
MLDTVFDIILQRINNLRNSVEVVSKFANTLWVVVADDEETMKLVFKQDGKLMISRKGTVSEGHYEPLLVANSIVITINGESRLYNHVYTDEGLMFLQLDDGESSPFVMINNNLLKGRSPKEYLQEAYVEPQKAKELKATLALTYFTSAWKGTNRVKIYRSQTSNRYFAYHNEEILKQGKYTFENNPTSILVIKELGEIEMFYTIQHYKQKDGSELVIHSKPVDGIINGCKAFVNDAPAPDGRYRLSWLKSVNVKSGVVTD